MNDSPMELQCLAAKCVCVRLLHEWAEGEAPIIDVWKKGNGYDTCSSHDWFVWQLYEMEVPQFANTPNKIRYQIEDNMVSILEQVVTWIQDHHGVNFFHDQPSSSLSEYIVTLVWNHHFKIDYAATAKNMLTNEKLSPLERFRFASTYCIVEEIEKFRDTMDSVPEWDFNEDPFVVYWNKYLNNELDTISEPGESPDVSVLDAGMSGITLKTLHLWPPVEHFFDKLHSEFKWIAFGAIILQSGERNLKHLLAKLTDTEWNSACRTWILKIVQKILQWGTLDDVRYMWNLFKSNMDSKNFCGILETLVPLTMIDASEFEKWTTVLMEIWISASSELKQSAIDMELWHRIGEQCCMHVIMNGETSNFRARRQINDPMKFIRLVLKSADVSKRMEFFEKNFRWLILWAPFAEVDKLIRNFLESYNGDVVKLKKSLANSHLVIERCVSVLLRFGEFDDFDAVLSFYFPGVPGYVEDDEDRMRRSLICYKWTLMTLTLGSTMLSMCLYFADWRKLYDYVKKIISQTRHIAPDEFMITLIDMHKSEEIRFWEVKLRNGESKDLRECLNAILSPNDHRLEELKEKFKADMFKILFDCDSSADRVFNQADVQDFLLWIYNDDDKLVNENFKQPELFSKGFLVQFQLCITTRCFQATKSLEEFLDWCFATESEKQQFKRKMIYDYREHKVIEDLLTRRRYRRSVLFWFFDGDASEIEKFTVYCARNPINSYFDSDFASVCAYSVEKWSDLTGSQD
ncbi:uncharacterized protein LOC135843931 [Planococcus citri]|uniref:uncharacterized protein LOC135843931 n=1 Tax=Planococcus citri TaxID=170843 RepID=UPI0031F76881